MKSEIFIEAAKKIASKKYDYCCVAIYFATGGIDYSPEEEYFSNIFYYKSEATHPMCAYWKKKSNCLFGDTSKENRDCRILALLLCYESVVNPIKVKKKKRKK